MMKQIKLIKQIKPNESATIPGVGGWKLCEARVENFHHAKTNERKEKRVWGKKENIVN